MSLQKKLISIVIPAYNEEDCVEELSRRLATLFKVEEKFYNFEVIIVENGSIDRTWQNLETFTRGIQDSKSLNSQETFGWMAVLPQELILLKEMHVS